MTIVMDLNQDMEASYNYRLEIKRVISRFKSGVLTEDQADFELEKIENRALNETDEMEDIISFNIGEAINEIRKFEMENRDDEDKAYGIHPEVRKQTDIIAKQHDEWENGK
jgi:hypothetical protein